MRLVSFSAADGKIRPGILVENENLIVDLSSDYSDTLAVIAAGVKSVSGLGTRTSYNSDSVRLHAPIGNPPRVFAIGLNYRDHAKEAGMAVPTTPVVFFKLTTAIVGPGEAIVLPKNSTEPDY